MRITDWKEGVWYTAPGFSQYRRVGHRIMYRERSGEGTESCDLSGATIFRDDWTEVVTDPCEAACRDDVRDRTYTGTGYTGDSMRAERMVGFRNGWSARGDSLKIDVEAAKVCYFQRGDCQEQQETALRRVIDAINAGEFRVKQ